MEYKFCVISSFLIHDPITNSYTNKVISDVFAKYDDALDYIRSMDYPPVKISIYTLTY